MSGSFVVICICRSQRHGRGLGGRFKWLVLGLVRCVHSICTDVLSSHVDKTYNGYVDDVLS